MKIFLDRTVCNCWEAACESDFADKYLTGEVKPTACTLAVVEDESENLKFFIKDRDGSEKEFIVNDMNLADAIDSWMLAYEEQQREKLAS